MISRQLLSLILLAAPLSADPHSDALELFKAQKLPEARLAFQALAKAEPANASPRHFLGLIALRLGESDEAVRQLEQAVALDPSSSNYHTLLGNAYGSAAGKAGKFAQIGLARKCRAALEKAVELDPDNLQARNALVGFYRQAPSLLGGGLPKAYVQAEEIRKRDPRQGAIVLGQLYEAEGRFDEAFAVADDILQADPDSYLGHYAIGRAAAQSGQRLEAGEKHLRRCLELTPAPTEPGHAPVHWRLGNLAEKRGDPAAARTAYETALRLDPNFKPAATALAKLK